MKKISIVFSKFTDANFLTKAEHISVSMTGNDNFPDPVPALVEVAEAVTQYNADLIAAEGLGRNNIAKKNQSRAILEQLLAQLGMYVMFVANGNVAILTSSGYTLTKEREPRYITNPGNVKLINGVTSGEMMASIKPPKASTGFLHEISSEPPSETTVWTSTATTRSKFTFRNLQPGKQYWVRIAALGSNDQIAYSTIATQFVQ